MTTAEQTRCGWALLAEGRICDKPATGVYVGLGGRQPVCAEHAEWLRRRWGVKVRSLEAQRVEEPIS